MCHGEAQAILDVKAEIIKLEKNFQAKTKDLKAEVDSRLQ